jgi:hypothetical protein
MLRDVFPTASALHFAGMLALDLGALAVLACFAVLARRDRALLALAAVVVVAIGAAGGDLAVTAVADLAVLFAVSGPTLGPSLRHKRL